LPPYSVSDVSEAVDSDTVGDQGTPRAGTRQLEEEELDADVVREMERRADEFFETGLRGRCFDVWAQASDWVQVSRRDSAIDLVLMMIEDDRADRCCPFQYPSSPNSSSMACGSLP
jgi:hypothetical protein